MCNVMLSCRGSIRLPNGNLSPAAFSPIPRSAAKAALQVPVGSALLLPSKEPQLHFDLLWEQDVASGNFSNDYFESLLALSTAPMPMLQSRLHGLLRVLFHDSCHACRHKTEHQHMIDLPHAGLLCQVVDLHRNLLFKPGIA